MAITARARWFCQTKIVTAEVVSTNQKARAATKNNLARSMRGTMVVRAVLTGFYGGVPGPRRVGCSWERACLAAGSPLVEASTRR